jgi:hypothetical protein
MKYSRPVTEDIEYIIIEAKLQAREGLKLTFTADVRDQNERLLARGKAFHWIVEHSGEGD